MSIGQDTEGAKADAAASLALGHERLLRLYEISRLLTSFEGVEQTVLSVFGIVAQGIHLRSAVFVREVDGHPKMFFWNARDVAAKPLRAAIAHARDSFAYLAGPGAGPLLEPELPDSAEDSAGLDEPSKTDQGFVVLPLVVDHRPIFGAVQFEAADGLQRADLIFLNAVVNQLAVAVDRYSRIQASQAQAVAGQRTAERRQAAAESSSERNAALARENEQLYEEGRRAVRAREDVLAIVAHDLRNPLSTVFLAAKSVVRHLEDVKFREQNRKQIDAIVRSAGRMDRLINDLLDFANIESGHLTIDLKPCLARELVHEAAESQRFAAAEKSLQLLADASNLGELVVECDRERILQVFANLVGNAIKFTPSGGAVTVRADVPWSGKVRFSVADTGAGIAPEAIPRLFERYWQARQTARKGSGLGLSIAKGIVEAHGGRIWAQSERGVGSTFYFVLTADSSAPAAP